MHAGGKFNDRTYQHAGGLHGVGVSVVNALSKHLEVWVRRGGKEYNLSFAGGRATSKLEVVGDVAKSKTGTTLRFWPDPKYFDTDKFASAEPQAGAARQSGAVPELAGDSLQRGDRRTRRMVLHRRPARVSGRGARQGRVAAPRRPSTASATSMAARSIGRSPGCLQSEHRITESYVNLIPTVEGGTHVNGLRAGVADAVREFCEFRNLVPRGLKVTPEDVWDGVSFVLSMKMRDPQFAGQTKERLSSRESAGIVQGVIKDAFALWLNQHPDQGEKIAMLAIDNAQQRFKDSQKDRPQARGRGTCAAGQARRLRQPGSRARRAVPGRGRFGRRFGEAGARPQHAGHHAAARQDTEHLGVRRAGGAALAGSSRHQRRHRRRSRAPRICRACATTRSASSPMRTATDSTSRRCCARCSCAITGRWCRPATSTCACRRCFASTPASR